MIDEFKWTIEDIVRLEVNAVDEKVGQPETWATIEDFRKDYKVRIEFTMGDFDKDAMILFSIQDLSSPQITIMFGSAHVAKGSIDHLNLYHRGDDPLIVDLREDG